jgi:hypothetical protein
VRVSKRKAPKVKETDVRITPDPLWSVVLEFKGQRRICDVCTEADNPLGADRFFTEKDNALACRWATTYSEVFDWTYWDNCPYSRGQVIQFARCSVRWARVGLEILMLTQADVSTNWYAYLRANSDARCHLDKRVGFLKPDGIGGYERADGSAKFGSAIWYWGPRRQRFARIFGAHGEVLHGLGPEETA